MLLSLGATPGWGLWAGAWNASGGSPICGGSVTINGGALPLSPWAGITCTSALDASVMSLVLSGRGLQGTVPAALGSLVSLEACAKPPKHPTTPHCLAAEPWISGWGGEPPALMSPVCNPNIIVANIAKLPVAPSGGAVSQWLQSLPVRMVSFALLSATDVVVRRTQNLDLTNNSLTGTIPSSLGGLTKLKTLDLSDNAGVVLSIGKSIDLKKLGLELGGSLGSATAVVLAIVLCTVSRRRRRLQKVAALVRGAFAIAPRRSAQFAGRARHVGLDCAR